MNRPTPRRTVLAAALAVAAGAATPLAHAASPSEPSAAPKAKRLVDYRAWHTAADWKQGIANGTRVVNGSRPGVAIDRPAGSAEYRDPHTGTTATWEYAVWTSPARTLKVPFHGSRRSWNAHTPAGTWITVEMRGTYSDGGRTPWYVMGRSGRRGRRHPPYLRRRPEGREEQHLHRHLRHRQPGERPAAGLLRTARHPPPQARHHPHPHRVAPGPDGVPVPDRFDVPASKPGVATGRELTVPRYSQEIHKGQYPEYDNGGEAWCSPTSSQMIIEYWGRKPTAADLAWVNPAYADPQVCHAARFTYDYQYQGCGNWPFNTAYAATYRDMEAAVTRLGTLSDAETLIRAGIPVITSQSFLATELTGAGYGTAGHLMTVIGFKSGDVIANDPNSPTNAAVRRVYQRRQFENIWLRTKRKNAEGKVVSGTGGICYVYFPREISAVQRAALAAVGISYPVAPLLRPVFAVWPIVRNLWRNGTIGADGAPMVACWGRGPCP
ncbi:Peptidase C39 family protein OS=Streptomyces rimosus subsp. rimosus (strain ATCC / DSM 40260/ JCM 4667 / NRRL 2234) OX=1265868 GN=SRIM_006410 PE=4 SV=1 [Streptomyces rimosus subsp. rimosus]